MNQDIATSFPRLHLIMLSRAKDFVSVEVGDHNDDVDDGDEYCFKAILTNKRKQETLFPALDIDRSTHYLIFRVYHGWK